MSWKNRAKGKVQLHQTRRESIKQNNLRPTIEFEKRIPYTRVTRLSWLQETWNQVQGLTRFWSQLWSTWSGSDKLCRRAYRASPSEFASTRLIRTKVRVKEATKSSNPQFLRNAMGAFRVEGTFHFSDQRRRWKLGFGYSPFTLSLSLSLVEVDEMDWLPWEMADI